MGDFPFEARFVDTARLRVMRPVKAVGGPPAGCIRVTVRGRSAVKLRLAREGSGLSKSASSTPPSPWLHQRVAGTNASCAGPWEIVLRRAAQGWSRGERGRSSRVGRCADGLVAILVCVSEAASGPRPAPPRTARRARPLRRLLGHGRSAARLLRVAPAMRTRFMCPVTTGSVTAVRRLGGSGLRGSRLAALPQ